MKLTNTKTKIIGVMLGEFASSVIPSPSFSAKFALIAGEGNDADVVGYTSMSTGWSEKTIAAYAALVAAMEEDALDRLFEKKEEPAAGTEEGAEADEPQQF